MTNDPGIVETRQLTQKLEAMKLSLSIGDFVRERAAALGDQPAANWFETGVVLSYRELDDRSDRLAAALLKRGIRKGAHVAMMLPNAPEAVISWFAIAKLGAVMIPVNTAYTGSELDFLLNQSDAQAVIIDGAYIGSLEAMSRRPDILSDDRVFVRGTTDAPGTLDALMAETEPFVAPWPVVSTDLASLQYTSGTTGFPKGCMLSHDYWMLLSHTVGVAMADLGVKRSLLWAPIFYMDPQWQLLMTMKLGGTAYIAQRMSLSRFFGWAREYEINYTYFPEAALKTLPKEADEGLRSLKYINAFGWSPDSIREVEQRLGVVARDSFGMTEIGAGMMMPVASQHKQDKPYCGVAAPFRETRIMDEDGHECAADQPGELQVRGRNILWGYYKRPDANKDAFDGDWFRTGDMFIKDADGYLRIVGRIKDMVRRSGENIAALEVETAITEFAGIEEAAVVPVPDPLRKEEVKAYLKLVPGAGGRDSFPMEQFLAHCAKRLAAFKVPRYVSIVEDDFPRTPSRKVAKRKLMETQDDLRTGAFDRVDGIWR